MSEQGDKGRKLLSPDELKGGRKNAGRKRNAWLSAVLMVAALGVAVGVYYLSGVIKPASDPEATAAPSTVVKIVDHAAQDFDRVTVQLRGQEPYTVVSNIVYEATAQPEGVTPAPDSTAEATLAPMATPTPAATPTAAPTATANSAGATVAPAATAASATGATVEPTADPAATAQPEATALPNYTIEGKPQFVVNEEAVSSQVSYCSAMSATQLVEENVTDLERFGLADPAIRVTMYYRDGSSAEWLFGDKVPTSSGYYVAPAGIGTVYMTYSSPYTAFNKPLNELHVVAMPVTLDPTTINDLIIEQKGQETVELKMLGEGEQTLSISSLRLVQPFVYDAHSERSTEMMEGTAALTITGYAGQLEELPEAGLDDPKIRIIASDPNGSRLDFRVGNNKDASTVYVQVDDTNAVYLADTALLSFVSNAKASYLVDQFSNLINIVKVDKIDVVTKTDSFAMSIERVPQLDESGNPVTNDSGVAQSDDTYYFDGEVTDTDLFKKLYQVMIGTLVSKISDDRNIQGDVVASVTYTLNVDLGSFTVEYLEYDSEYYAVRRDGMTLFLIKRDRVENLITQLQNYRAGTFVPES